MVKAKNNPLGQRLIELEIKRSDLATRLGVNLRTVYKWMGYEVEPRLSFEQTALLCKALQWDVDQLASAYAAGKPPKKKRLGVRAAPGQLSLLS